VKSVPKKKNQSSSITPTRKAWPP